MGNSSNPRTCKWCTVPLTGGRQSKAYCSDVCKQAAYYHRRKSSRNNGVTAADRDSVTNASAEGTTNHNNNSVTDSNDMVADSLPTRPEMAFNDQSNNHLTMENNHNPDKNSDTVSPLLALPAGQVIDVMGMGINREFITGLLESMPEAQQRELSLMLLETVTQLFPDLMEHLAGIPSAHSRTVALETVPEEQDGQDESHYKYGGGDQDEEGDDDSDYYGDDEGEYDYGHHDGKGEASESEDEDEAPDNNEDSLPKKDDGSAIEGKGMNAENDIQSGYREEWAGSRHYASRQHTPSDAANADIGHTAHLHSVTASEQDVPVFRLGGSMNKGDNPTAKDADRHETRNNPHGYQPANTKYTRQTSVTEPHDINIQFYKQTGNTNESSGNYLNRFFDSSRITRGMKVWEELSVTVRAFMESYVTRYATDHMIGAQSAGAAGSGFVTLHILFHRSQHRRAICRLLDLVLESEEGLLSETHFRPEDVFSAHHKTAVGNDADDDEGEENWEDDDNAGAIDYECYGTNVPCNYSTQSGAQYVPAHGMGAQQITNPVLQILGIGVQQRT